MTEPYSAAAQVLGFLTHNPAIAAQMFANSSPEEATRWVEFLSYIMTERRKRRPKYSQAVADLFPETGGWVKGGSSMTVPEVIQQLIDSLARHPRVIAMAADRTEKARATTKDKNPKRPHFSAETMARRIIAETPELRPLLPKRPRGRPKLR